MATRNATTVTGFASKLLKDRPTGNKLFYHGNRLAAVHHTRLRLGCSALRLDLFRDIKVVDSPICACGQEDESAYHFLFVCRLYSKQRVVMIENLYKYASPSLKLVLEGSDALTYEQNTQVFDIVHAYIRQTRRFY